MSEKQQRVFFTVIMVFATATVFFALGFAVAGHFGFVKEKVVVDSSVIETTSASTTFSGQIDINSATVEDWMKIEGIGEKTAQNIIAYRESVGGFQYLEQLLYVDGIGETKFSRWLPYLTIEGKSSTSISETATTATVVQAPTVLSGKMNLNLATKEDLMTISGVGEKLATSIILYREQIGAFSELEQLLEIDGIGEKRFAVLREHLQIND